VLRHHDLETRRAEESGRRIHGGALRGSSRAVRDARERFHVSLDPTRVDERLEPRRAKRQRIATSACHKGDGRDHGDASNLVVLRWRLDRQISRMRRLAFVPPNPKEFDRATGSFFSRAVFGV